MKKLKYIKCVIFLLSALYFVSCEQNFNDEPIDFIQKNDIYIDSTFVIHYVNDLYVGLPTGYNRLGGNSMISSSVDESVEGGNNSEAELMALGVWTPDNLRDNSWGDNYTYIRKTNLFLNDIQPGIPAGLFNSQNTIDELEGQVRFMRALHFFELLKRYGGVPIVTELLDLEEGLSVSRATYDETVDFIVNECDLIIDQELLPLEWPQQNSNFGRATLGAAMALKARTLLYAASPLFNDPSNPENSLEHGAYNQNKWVLAAEAAHELIALNQYGLYNNYANFFIRLNGNNEIILSNIAGPNNSVERLNAPTGFTGGQGGAAPTLDLVEAFRMADGSDFDWNNPVHAANPFANREDRFYHTILYNERVWFGRPIETYEGGMDLGSDNSTKTGFYLRKFLDPNALFFGGSTGTTFHCFPLFRYAEVLLNYAEAMNEAYGPDNNGGLTMTSRDALNLIRDRGDLEPFNTSVSKDEMRDEIHRERRIELAFEEHRHLDLRRWKTSLSELNQPVSGLNITRNTDGSFNYEKTNSQSRVFSEAMYLYPIPRFEINRNTNLIQNSSW